VSARAGDGHPQLSLEVTEDHGLFHAKASFHTPLTPCQAFDVLAAHDLAKQIPGVKDSKSTRVAPDRVRVERWGSESMLLFKIDVHSIVEYTEHPPTRMDFVQIAGDFRRYAGHWDIVPEGTGTELRYESVLEPDSIVPTFLIHRFVRDRLHSRLQAGLDLIASHAPADPIACTAAPTSSG
jgi:hypothetical protein